VRGPEGGVSKLTFWARSDWGDLGFLGRILVAEGHAFTMYAEHPEAADVGRGFYELTRSKEPPRGSIVLFDSPGHGDEGTALRRRGHQVIGGTPVDTELELKRGRAMQILEDAGIAIPETHRFKTFGAAIAFLKHRDDDEEWFFKAEGNKSTALSDGGPVASLLRYLQWARQSPVGRAVDEFILQKGVKGVEISTEGWWDGKRFVYPFNGTFEEKRLMDGNLGPRTGCQENVVWLYHDKEPAIAEQTVVRLADVLGADAFPVDVNAIVDDEGIAQALEVSPRFGFDAFPALVALMREGTVGEQLAAFAAGELARFELAMDKLALTRRVSIPPFPMDEVLGESAAPRRGRGKRVDPIRELPLDRQLLDLVDRFYLDDVMLEDDEPVCAGRDGNLLMVVATGDELEELREEVMQLVLGLDVRNKQARTDPPVERAEKNWRTLRTLGLLRDGPPESPDDDDDPAFDEIDEP
jgi:phosphoribosylamine--glycine ligase